MISRSSLDYEPGIYHVLLFDPQGVVVKVRPAFSLLDAEVVRAQEIAKDAYSGVITRVISDTQHKTSPWDAGIYVEVEQ